MSLFLKYLVTVVVPAAIQFFGGKYLGQEAAAGLAVAVGAGGARVLHLQDPPAKAP